MRADPEGVDPVWLTGVLEQAGVARGATLTEVRFDGLIGTGQTGRNARFSLAWDAPEGRPSSVVGKFASGDPAARESAFATGAYLREWNFYTHVAQTVSVRTPHCWAARFDPLQPAFVIIMEDLAESRQGDQFVGLSIDEADLALGQAVALHAPRWGDPSLDALFAEPATTPDERSARLQMFYGMTLEPCLERLAPGLNDDVCDLARRFSAKVGSWTAGTGTASTVVHYDFRPDNLLFGQTPAAPPVAVVDWQTVNAGLAMSDVAYLIGGSFEPGNRAAVERDLVEGYRRRLETAGVRYDADACWRDYRFGTLWGMIITVIATVVAEKTDRGDALFTTMASRHGRHALDLDALSLLD